MLSRTASQRYTSDAFVFVFVSISNRICSAAQPALTRQGGWGVGEICWMAGWRALIDKENLVVCKYLGSAVAYLRWISIGLHRIPET